MRAWLAVAVLIGLLCGACQATRAAEPHCLDQSGAATEERVENQITRFGKLLDRCLHERWREAGWIAIEPVRGALDAARVLRCARKVLEHFLSTLHPQASLG